jgi:hypothetical protein
VTVFFQFFLQLIKTECYSGLLVEKYSLPFGDKFSERVFDQLFAL